MTPLETEHCAAVAMRLRDRMQTLLSELDRVMLFGPSPNAEQLRAWVGACERCLDIADNLYIQLDDAVAQPTHIPLPSTATQTTAMSQHEQCNTQQP
jgi:hypothetical protein